MSSPIGAITPDKFVTTASSSAGTAGTIVFFIPGNPGLVSYYHLFLSLLARDLSPAGRVDKEEDFVICAHSLGGFEVGQSTEEKGKKTWTPPQRLYGLTEQIEFVEEQLEECVQSHRTGSLSTPSSSSSSLVREEKDKSRPKVILIGHSVGSYIAMEILRRWHEKRDDKSMTMEIVGGVMLFPTVVDIAKSPSGRKLTQLLFIPYLAVLVSFIAKIIAAALPNPVLSRLVRIVMRNPREDAVNSTIAFLRSQCGVHQAIHMAADEMRDISADKWSDEIWGISSPDNPSKNPSRSPVKLQFYFGRNDHWVAEQTRDDIIRARAAKTTSDVGSRPKMVVCGDNIPHGFCISHSETMVPKVANFIRDIIEEERMP